MQEKTLPVTSRLSSQKKEGGFGVFRKEGGGSAKEKVHNTYRCARPEAWTRSGKKLVYTSEGALDKRGDKDILSSLRRGRGEGHVFDGI